MSDTAKKWIEHRSIRLIRSHVKLLCLFLNGPHLSLRQTLSNARKCAEAYRQLTELGFIEALPLYSKIKGVSSNIDVLLPGYAFPDYFLSKIRTSLESSFFDANNPESLVLNDQLKEEVTRTIRTIQSAFKDSVFFESRDFMKQPPEKVIEIMEKDFTFRGIDKLFK